MANSYFKFKQFTINQDRCAMKVCTDACLFGAMVAMAAIDVGKTEKHIQALDIGTGTGLLSLMYTQKNNQTQVDAVELDEQAAAQAQENIQGSPWAENISVINTNILNYNPGKTYDLIFSNPPFFEDDLKSPDDLKNMAKHHTSLTLTDMIDFADKHISQDGMLAVLLPFHRVANFIEEAATKGFHVAKKILVKQTFKHKFFRGILFLTRNNATAENGEIIIKQEDHKYTEEFTTLLKDYYLYL